MARPCRRRDRARLAATYGDNHERLVAVKRAPPTDFIHENQNISPDAAP